MACAELLVMYDTVKYTSVKLHSTDLTVKTILETVSGARISPHTRAAPIGHKL